MKKNLIFLLTAVTGLGFSSCEKEVVKEIYSDSQGAATLNFDTRFGDQDFELNKKYDYKLTNESGTYNLQFDFNRFRYWVSNVKLINATGQEILVPNSYYLVEETDELVVDHSNDVYPATKREEIQLKNIPVGQYKSIKFSIGVEPKYNDNFSLTTGELGVLNGMGFDDGWMWFTSYKFLNLKGNIYWADGNPNKKTLLWDIGSNDLYTGAEKEVTFDKNIEISGTTTSNINFNVDVKELLSTTPYPWANNTISQTTKDLMKGLRDTFLSKAIVFKGTDSKTK
ncbi:MULTISPECIES: MbnP family protein [unclassified Sphingobacterium]|uniref:MbnP family protein n=1 Tax=unclassified Sphingobacterium TaxID=2609468 RepID=UPI0025EE373B|nr:MULTISPECIES: MbnP family protein [unclassified Sphingobacterium]